VWLAYLFVLPTLLLYWLLLHAVLLVLEMMLGVRIVNHMMWVHGWDRTLRLTGIHDRLAMLIPVRTTILRNIVVLLPILRVCRVYKVSRLGIHHLRRTCHLGLSLLTRTVPLAVHLLALTIADLVLVLLKMLEGLVNFLSLISFRFFLLEL